MPHAFLIIDRLLSVCHGCNQAPPRLPPATYAYAGHKGTKAHKAKAPVAALAIRKLTRCRNCTELETSTLGMFFEPKQLRRRRKLKPHVHVFVCWRSVLRQLLTDCSQWLIDLGLAACELR